MSMSFKDGLEKCIDYLRIQYESSSATEDEAESIEEYLQAINAALDVIEYYEGCSEIIKAKEGAKYIKDISEAWYKMQTARIGERFGIGYDNEK